MSVEEWRSVPGYPAYEVSDHGRVRSIDRIQTYIRRFKDGSERMVKRAHKGQLLRPGTVQSGHQLVVLGRGHSKLVHALVLIAFVGPRPDGYDSRHLDDIPFNNQLSNLSWGTRTQNLLDAVANGCKPIGDDHQGAKLREVDIPIIRQLLTSNSMPAVAKVYGVSRGAIQAIKRGISWKHVP